MKSSEFREAIHRADLQTMRALLEAEPALATADVEIPDGSGNRVPALHYVCNAVFDGHIDDLAAAPLADALLAAGVDPNAAYAKSGDSYLIAAASLRAEAVGLRMLDAGADPTPRGLFGATALHWAALMGLTHLVERLATLPEAELELRDTHYGSTPLQWALHAWKNGANGRREGLPSVARALLSAGANGDENARALAASEA